MLSRANSMTLSFLTLVVLVQAIVLPLIFGAPVADICLIVYFSFGSLFIAYSILGMDAPAGSQGELESLILNNARQKAVKNRWLRAFAIFLEWLVSGLNWPVVVLYFLFLFFRRPELIRDDIKKSRRLRTTVLTALYPQMVFQSVWFVLIPVVMLIIVQQLKAEPAYFNFMAATVLASIGVRHVLHLIAPPQEALRKAKAPVALNYVTIVVCDLAALILCYHILLSTLIAGIPKLAEIKDIYDRLGRFKDVFLLALDRPTQTIDYALGMSGLLWVITLAKDMLNLKGYARTTTDRCARVFGLALCGFEAEARHEIASITPETDQEIKILAEAHIILGDYLPGLGLTKRYAVRRGEQHDVQGISNALLLMGEVAYHGGDPERLTRAINFLVAHGLNSVQMIFATAASGMGEFVAVSKSPDLSDRLLLAKAYILWDAGERRDGIRAFKQLPNINKLEVGEEGFVKDTAFDIDDACTFAVFLLILEALVETDEEAAAEVERQLAEYSTPFEAVVVGERKFTTLFLLCFILTLAASRLKRRSVDPLPVLRLADFAFNQIEPSLLIAPFREDLINLRNRPQL